MKKLTLFLFLCYFNIYSQNTIEQVRVIKDDKQIDELFSEIGPNELKLDILDICLLYTSPSPRDRLLSRMPSSA